MYILHVGTFLYIFSWTLKPGGTGMVCKLFDTDFTPTNRCLVQNE